MNTSLILKAKNENVVIFHFTKTRQNIVFFSNILISHRNSSHIRKMPAFNTEEPSGDNNKQHDISLKDSFRELQQTSFVRQAVTQKGPATI